MLDYIYTTDKNIEVSDFSNGKRTIETMSAIEFFEKYEDNIKSAFDHWRCQNEEHLPVSVLKGDVDKNVHNYFYKQFVYNFNKYAYISGGKQEYIPVDDYHYERRDIPYIFIQLVDKK